MGKYMRKAKMTGDVAVMEVSLSSLGMLTRAKTLALQRLQNNPNTSPSSFSYLQLRSRRLRKPLPVATTDTKKPKDACRENPDSRLSSGSAVFGSVRSSSMSCSKNGSESAAGTNSGSFVNTAERAEGSRENDVGLEASFGENVPDMDERERNIRETTPSSLIRNSESLGTPGSTTRPTSSAVKNRRMQHAMWCEIPTEHDLEEFFAQAEQEQLRKFTEKYNFDTVNDMPLSGRYEWVKLDP